jgi:hypothetical protein
VSVDRAPAKSPPSLFKWSGSGVEALVDEFDRADVVAAVPEHPAERMVELVDVAAAQATLR